MSGGEWVLAVVLAVPLAAMWVPAIIEAWRETYEAPSIRRRRMNEKRK